VTSRRFPRTADARPPATGRPADSRVSYDNADNGTVSVLRGGCGAATYQTPTPGSGASVATDISVEIPHFVETIRSMEIPHA